MGGAEHEWQVLQATVPWAGPMGGRAYRWAAQQHEKSTQRERGGPVYQLGWAGDLGGLLSLLLLSVPRV